jgi:lipopolysaccharide/colanic/teichoic acid biosynthesis glycosyltransferase
MQVFVNGSVVRALDLVLTLILIPIALLVSAPFLILKVLCDGRPLFYNSRRVGRGGVEFTVYKFRTMVADSDFIRAELGKLGRKGFEVIPTSSPVYTRIGRIFERFQIVEFPQLMNVLKGDMSLLGYRPLPQTHCTQLEEELGPLMVEMRHRHKPGITGLTQLIGKSGLTNRERVAAEIAFSRFLYGPTRFHALAGLYVLVIVETLLAVVVKKHLFTRYIWNRVRTRHSQDEASVELTEPLVK